MGAQSEAEWFHTARGVLFESGTPHTLELTAGEYRIEVPSDEDRKSIEIEILALD